MTPPTLQQNGGAAPSQQQQGQMPAPQPNGAPQQQGATPIFRDWAAI